MRYETDLQFDSGQLAVNGAATLRLDEEFPSGATSPAKLRECKPGDISVPLQTLINYIDNPEIQSVAVSQSSEHPLTFRHNTMMLLNFKQEVYHLGGFVEDEVGNSQAARITFARHGKAAQFMNRVLRRHDPNVEVRLLLH